jgi:hypothetical protein
MPTAPNETQAGGHAAQGPNTQSRSIIGKEIWVYGGNGGSALIRCTFPIVDFPIGFSTFTFWRFMLQIHLGRHEMKVSYSVNQGQELEFFVPGRTENMRWAAYSVR